MRPGRSCGGCPEIDLPAWSIGPLGYFCVDKHPPGTLPRLAARPYFAAKLGPEVGPGPDFAAALAATLDGARAVLAVGAKDAMRVERLRSGLGGTGR